MGCEECPFNGSKKVPGGGFTTIEDKIVEVKEERDYDIVIVAMAPAREEIEQGIVLVGVSGQILRKHLYQMGITDYYACNVLLCPITDDKSVGEAVKCCRSVIEEVWSKHPKLTIALGDLPLHTLAPDIKYSIKECEGRVLPSLVGPMLPLTHPAFYWRHPDEVFDFTECMRSGLRFMDGKYTQADNPTFTVVDKDNLSEVLQKVDRYEEVAVDLETTGFQAFGWEPCRILEMGIAGEINHAYIVPAKFMPEFKEILEKKKTDWWNAPFDCGFLSQLDITPRNINKDGMLQHYSIDERPYSHGLKRVSQIYLGTEDWEKGIDKYLPSKKTSSYELIPEWIRYDYLAKDVTRTLYLCNVLDEFINKEVFDRLLMPACRMFIDIERRGQRVDPVKLMDLENILGGELSRLSDEILKEGGVWVNPSSPKQVSNLVYNILGIPVDPFYGFSTSKAYLANFRDSHPIISNILDYREISKLKNGYVEQFAKFVDRTFRIHPDIKISAAVTGRLSSANPSIMNIKSLKELKRVFLPDDGSLMGYFDIKANELRWYCIISGDEELTRILKEGGDPHEVVRMAVYGPESDEDAKTLQRTWAKAVVFGRIYKRTRASIERQVGRGVIDAVMEAVDSIAPHIEDYYKWIMQEVRSKGYLESYFGRKRRFSLITPDTKKEVERQAVNFPIQSSGSDLMLLCMLHIWEMKDKWGVWPFWPFHDSITMNIPDVPTLYEVQKELEAYSLELVNGAMPFTWKPDWGYNWALDKEPPIGERVTITMD